MSEIAKTVRETFRLFCLSLQCDLVSLPATGARLEIMERLERIGNEVDAIEHLLTEKGK
jgi:hypothetical protein